MALRHNLFLLSTGVLLNVVSQMLVSSKDFAASSAQIMPWVKYTGVLLPAAASRLRQGGAKAGAATTLEQRRLLTRIGLLDVVAYTMFSMAYYSCGAALSSLLLAASAQVLTALSTVFILKRRLTRGQWVGIVCILLGISFRAIPFGGSSGSKGGGNSSSSSSSALKPEQWVSVGMIVAAAVLYSMVGVYYERLTKGSPRPPPMAEVSWHTSKLGFLVTSGFQLLYTLPRFDSLVRARMARNGVAWWEVPPLLLIFAAMFNLHMLAQNIMFKAEGAIGVGVVNSVRGAALTGVTSLLFCSPQQPWLCLTLQSGLSAAVITLGGIVWVLSDPNARALKQAPKGQVLDREQLDTKGEQEKKED